jgi:hypothetical protein
MRWAGATVATGMEGIEPSYVSHRRRATTPAGIHALREHERGTVERCNGLTTFQEWVGIHPGAWRPTVIWSPASNFQAPSR